MERWRALADKRLAHVTDLYETGRWQRYFSERDFLAMMRETREAVESWHRLVPEIASADVVELAPSRTHLPTPSFVAAPNVAASSVKASAA
ncbi:hypothetical protein X566_15865 [Afipia sp. P52-10]|nr:hypothetical protein X566_15865 [Afipia sp. P52-10]